MDSNKIPLEFIREHEVALRKVNKESEQYQGLVDSIKEMGVLNPIVVRPARDASGVLENRYDLIDGLHRFSAAKDAGLKEIPANVTTLNDGEVLTAQLIANIHKVDTKPVEYSRQLVRILAQNPTMTLTELGKQVARSLTWIQERLDLADLDPKIGELVDKGDIKLANAYALTKLPSNEQVNFIDQAVSMPTAEFGATIDARAKEVRAAIKEGRKANPPVWAPVAKIKSIKEIQEILESDSAVENILSENGVKNKKDAALTMLNWVLSLDKLGVQDQTEKHNIREAEKAKAAADRKAETERKKAEKGAQAQAAIANA